MSVIVSPAPRLVLADRVFARSRLLDVVLVIAGASLTAVLAQLVIPLPYVPVTGQSLAVLLVGASLGWARGAAALVLYVVAGLAGLPVFAPEEDGSHLVGPAALGQPSFGYLIGFVAAAALVGWLSERAWDRHLLTGIATFIGGTLVVFAFGLVWLAFAAGLDLAETLRYGLLPFLPGGVLKSLLAAGLLPLAWWGAAHLERYRAENNDED